MFSRTKLRCAISILLFSLLADYVSYASAAPALHLLDLDGNVVEPLQEVHSHLTVFIFTRTDCPISNRYAPVIEELDRKLAPRGVSFWLIYIDPHQPAEELRQHVKEYRYHLHVARDPKHNLVRLAGAQITPEATVFSAQGQLVYRGRIDNRYVDVGQALPAPTRNDLELTLNAILAGSPVPQKTTTAVGCYISDLE
jgi:Redoxin